MKKSGEFWLNCLSDDVKEKWLKNYDPDFCWLNMYSKIPLSDYLKLEIGYNIFIIEAFEWDKSPEGMEYWESIFRLDEKKLLRNYKLKQLGI